MHFRGRNQTDFFLYTASLIRYEYVVFSQRRLENLCGCGINEIDRNNVMCLPELFKELFAIFFVCDGKNDDLFWMDSIINSKNTASQTIKWRVKVCQFFYSGFIKRE